MLCEKPFVTDLSAGQELVELASSQGRHLVINQQYRFMESHWQARRLIGSEEFGELLFLDARQTFRTDRSTEAGWRGSQDRRTLLDFGTHVLDLCRFFFDGEPVRITARIPKPGASEGADGLVLLRLDFPGDRVAQVTLDRLTRGRHRYLELRLDGSRGTLETRLGGGIHLGLGIRGGTRRPYAEVEISGGGRARLYQGERWSTIARDPLDLFAHATRRLIRDFLDSLEAGREPKCSAADNLRTVALMLAGYEAAECGGALDLDWNPWPRWSKRRP